MARCGGRGTSGALTNSIAVHRRQQTSVVTIVIVTRSVFLFQRLAVVVNVGPLRTTVQKRDRLNYDEIHFFSIFTTLSVSESRT